MTFVLWASPPAAAFINGERIGASPANVGPSGPLAPDVPATSENGQASAGTSSTPATSPSAATRPSANGRPVATSRPVTEDRLFPAAVRFTVIQDAETGSGYSCSATKIGEKEFLTAAHCVTDKLTGEAVLELSAKNPLIFINTVGQQSKVTIQKISIHPNWSQARRDFAFKALNFTLEMGQAKMPEDLQFERLQTIEAQGIDLALISVNEKSPQIKIAKIRQAYVATGDEVALGGFGVKQLFESPAEKLYRMLFGGAKKDFGFSYHAKTVDLITPNGVGFISFSLNPDGVERSSLAFGDSGGGAYIKNPTTEEYELIGVNSMILNETVLGVHESLLDDEDKQVGSYVVRAANATVDGCYPSPEEWLNSILP